MTPALAATARRSACLLMGTLALGIAVPVAAQPGYADGITVYGHPGRHRLPNDDPELSRRVHYSDLDLTTLRLFVTVCETRNMARAAERVHMVGSAISKRLAQLEETVGTPLLQRRRHGVEPTPAGQTLLEHARDMLAGACRIERDMSAYAAGVNAFLSSRRRTASTS